MPVNNPLRWITWHYGGHAWVQPPKEARHKQEIEYFTDHWSTCLLQNSQIQFLIEIHEQYTGRETSHTLVVRHRTPGEEPFGVLKRGPQKKNSSMKSVLERWILNYSTWLDNNTKWDQTDSREYLRDCPSFVVHTCKCHFGGICSSFCFSKHELFHTFTKKMKCLSLHCDYERYIMKKLSISPPSNWGVITRTMNCTGSRFCNLKKIWLYWKTAMSWFLLGTAQHGTKDYITIAGLNKRRTLRAMINSWRYSPFHTFMKDITR